MKTTNKKKYDRIRFFGRQATPSGNCPNCQKPGPHFVPPSMGDAGFYLCSQPYENPTPQNGDV